MDNLESDDGKLAYLDSYNEINNALNEISLKLEDLLKDDGYDAKAVNASYILPDNV